MKSEVLDEILERTRDPDARTRKDAVRALCPCDLRFDSAAAWNRVLEMTGDPDEGVRSIVLHTLTDGSPRARETDVLAALDSMRDDPAPRLRRRVRRTLAHHRRTGQLNIG